MIYKNDWKQLDDTSTGYLGSKRNAVFEVRDKKFGVGNWKMGWLYGENILEYEDVCQLYEDAYFKYLKCRPELVSFLKENASDVYDDDPENVNSGTDYKKRGAVRTHIQDIAIRRCFMRLGLAFKGNRLIQIRDSAGKEPISKALSPGQVPFHQLDKITTPKNIKEVYEKRWWLEGSVEDFYQLNKRIFVKK